MLVAFAHLIIASGFSSMNISKPEQRTLQSSQKVVSSFIFAMAQAASNLSNVIPVNQLTAGFVLDLRGAG